MVARKTQEDEGSPIGRLYLEAEKNSARKANGHTSDASCGCQVTVQHVSPDTQLITFNPCQKHPTR